MSHAPTRTGLKSIRFLLEKVCKLVAKFRADWNDYLDEDQLAIMDNLVTVCNGVVAMIDLFFAVP